MLGTFRLENYKAFRTATLELKPITILLGSNGVGKTSIIRFLMMMHQTSQYFSAAPHSPLVINGDFAEMGEARKLIRQYNSRHEWSFSVDLPYKRFREVTAGLEEMVIESISQSTERTAFYIDAASRKQDVERLSSATPLFRAIREKFVHHRQQRSKGFAGLDEIADLYEQLLDLADALGDSFSEASSSHDELTLLDYNWTRGNMRRRLGGFTHGQPLTRTELGGLRRFLKSVDSLGSTDVSLRLSLRLTGDQKGFYIRMVSVRQGSETILEIGLNAFGDVTKISSDLVPDSMIDKYHQSLSRAFQPKRSLFQWIDPSSVPDSFTAFVLASFLSGIVRLCERDIDDADFYHIAPIRPFLERYISSHHRSRDALTVQGARLIDRLSDKEVRKSVDRWFREFDIAFEVKEITELLKELVTIQRRGKVQLSINDVGFGYSQVLPIIIEGTSRPENSLTMIEQPEVHLHPKMQAKLADFFIEASGVSPVMQLDGKKRFFLIETHSENILKRLRRRIAEGALSNADIAVYFLEDAPAGNTVRKVAVEADGDIDWPKDFYATDLEDTAAFFRATIGKSLRRPAHEE